MVLWCSGRSRAHAIESAWSSLERRAWGSRRLTFAAASSRAKGSPASRQQIAATEEAFSVVSEKKGEAARVRSTKSRPEGVVRISSSVGFWVEEGSVRGKTGYSCSPLTRKGARLDKDASYGITWSGRHDWKVLGRKRRPDGTYRDVREHTEKPREEWIALPVPDSGVLREVAERARRNVGLRLLAPKAGRRV